jgi:hypothetical protein
LTFIEASAGPGESLMLTESAEIASHPVKPTLGEEALSYEA